MPTGDAQPTVPSAQIPSRGPPEVSTAMNAVPEVSDVPEQHAPGIVNEKVEYRDQDGNLLDEDMVASLMAEGKASFSTKYETETVLVDELGNVVQEQSSIAPGHPDTEGVNPDTKGEPKPSSEPAAAEVSLDDSKEESLKLPKPASDVNEATK